MCLRLDFYIIFDFCIGYDCFDEIDGEVFEKIVFLIVVGRVGFG